MKNKSENLFYSKKEGVNLMKNKTQNLFNPMKEGVAIMKIKSKKGFGINEIIGIAAGVIIAAVVVIPGLRVFAQTMMTELTTGWEGMSTVLFS